MEEKPPATGNADQPTTAHEFDLAEFTLDRAARVVTPKTLSWYAQSFAHWRSFAADHAITTTEDITPRHLRRYLVHLAQRGHTPGGVGNIYGALRAFLNWYEAEIAAPEWQNPAHKVKAPRRSQELLLPLALTDFRALLAQCTPRTLVGDRDRALLLLLLDTGVRHQELTDLNVGDVDTATGTVLIRSGKGRKGRAVGSGEIQG